MYQFVFAFDLVKINFGPVTVVLNRLGSHLNRHRAKHASGQQTFLVHRHLVHGVRGIVQTLRAVGKTSR